MGWDYTPWQTSLCNILWAAHSSPVDQRMLVQACSLLQKMLNRMWEKVNSLQASTWAENNLKCLENFIQNTNIQITYSSSSKYDRIIRNEQHPWCFIMFFLFCFVFHVKSFSSESELVLVQTEVSEQLLGGLPWKFETLMLFKKCQTNLVILWFTEQG